MDLEEYRKTKRSILKKTLVFVIKGDQILLGLKKVRFGKGNWNGFGGKVESGETIIQAAKRELLEEVGLEVKDLLPVAWLNFYYPSQPIHNQQVTVYLSRDFTGEPVETEEMKPQWFNFKDIPYKQMWADDQYWLPKVLAGKKVEGWFLFNNQFQLLEFKVKEINA